MEKKDVRRRFPWLEFMVRADDGQALEVKQLWRAPTGENRRSSDSCLSRTELSGRYFCLSRRRTGGRPAAREFLCQKARGKKDGVYQLDSSRRQSSMTFHQPGAWTTLAPLLAHILANQNSIFQGLVERAGAQSAGCDLPALCVELGNNLANNSPNDCVIQFRRAI